MTPKITDTAVQSAFDAFPNEVRKGLLAIRALIFEVAAKDPTIGPLKETLKWGQPAYLTQETGSGTTIRLGVPKSGEFAIYTHCQTTVISELRAHFPDELAFDGNRAVVFRSDADIRPDVLALLIHHALTYHLSKA